MEPLVSNPSTWVQVGSARSVDLCHHRRRRRCAHNAGQIHARAAGLTSQSSARAALGIGGRNARSPPRSRRRRVPDAGDRRRPRPAGDGRGHGGRVDRRLEARREDRPEHLRPVRRASRHRHLRGRLGRSRFPHPQHPRHPQRRRGRAQGAQGAERALAGRMLRGRVPLAQGHRQRAGPRPSTPTGAASSSRTPSARTSSWTSSTRSAARPTSRSTSARARRRKPRNGWST